jgi:uncharacterized membrane protein
VAIASHLDEEGEVRRLRGKDATNMERHADRPTSDKRHPVVARLDRERAESVQLRAADRITAFAGSLPFVYLHVVFFGVWMLLFERSPWPTLALVVSLEAIFLSAFVLMGQNRQAAFQQAKADHEFAEAERELKTNTEVTRAIHELTTEMREHIVVGGARWDAGQRPEEDNDG